jgi:elongator complex protein 1
MTRYTNRTNGTLNTQTSRRTSKHRRREERKRASGRKGSVYEEEYLVNSVGRLIERINAVNEDVTKLVEGLFRRGMREQSRVIEDAMREVVGLCNALVAEVFEVKPKEDADQVHEDRPTGADGVLYEAMENLKVAKIAPMIKSFEGLSL